MLPQACESVKKTSSAAITTVPAYLFGFIIRYGDTAQASAVFKDGGSGGTEVLGISEKAGTNSGDSSQVVMLPTPLLFSTSMYLALTGTNTAVYVLFAEKGS